MEFLAFIGLIAAVGAGIYLLVISAQTLRLQRKGIVTVNESMVKSDEMMKQYEKMLESGEQSIRLSKMGLIQQKEQIETLKQLNKNLEKILEKLKANERTHP